MEVEVMPVEEREPYLRKRKLVFAQPNHKGLADRIISPNHIPERNNNFTNNIFTVIGPVVYSKSPSEICLINNAVITVANGKIVSIQEKVDSLQGSPSSTIIKLKKGEFLCPGLVDTHIHAPQYPNQGLGSDLPLLEWLTKYTFPLESKYSDPEFAERVYRYVVRSTLSCGTTTACYFGTIHTESTLRLCEIISDEGQRALVGKVCMNQNCPATYSEDYHDSILQTEKFVQAVNAIKNPLVKPVITPRFAIACDMPLLKSLGELAAKQDLYIQTHVSENKDEVEFAKKLFPDCPNYVSIYEKAGLLTEKTILAHGVHLTDSELKLMELHGSSLSHCPNSNTYLQSGLCDVRNVLKHNVKLGLGTDVSGGCSPSIVDAMRCALTTSIHVSYQKDNYKPLDYKEVFYLATLGGSKVLSMEDKIGSFAVGKDFDALVIDMMPGKGTAGVMDSHSLDELLQKFIYCGDSRNVKQVFVQGRLVVNH